MTASRPMLTADLHEIGTRLVDLLNQTGFLYRFPEFAGVTLACIAQHIEPTEALLTACKGARVRLGRSQSNDGYNVGGVTREDPLEAALQYALSGYRTFARHLQAIVADDADIAPADRQALIEALPGDRPGDPQQILHIKELIEARSKVVIEQAASDFEPMAEADWQGFRMVLFFFLIELEKCRQ